MAGAVLGPATQPSGRHRPDPTQLKCQSQEIDNKHTQNYQVELTAIMKLKQADGIGRHGGYFTLGIQVYEEVTYKLRISDNRSPSLMRVYGRHGKNAVFSEKKQVV